MLTLYFGINTSVIAGGAKNTIFSPGNRIQVTPVEMQAG